MKQTTKRTLFGVIVFPAFLIAVTQYLAWPVH